MLGPFGVRDDETGETAGEIIWVLLWRETMAVAVSQQLSVVKEADWASVSGVQVWSLLFSVHVDYMAARWFQCTLCNIGGLAGMTFDCKVHFNDTSSGILHVVHRFPEEVTGEVIMGKTSGAQKNASHDKMKN